MEQKDLYRILAPVVNAWNYDHEYGKLSCVLDDDIITISPEKGNHLPGPVLSDIAMLSAVYGFCYGVHTNGNTPYILA